MTSRRPRSAFPTPGETERARVLVNAYVRLESERIRIEARQARLLAELLELGLAQQERGGAEAGDIPVRSLTAEVAAASRVSPRTMSGRMGDAWSLKKRFPATMAAFAEGEVSRPHASVVAECGARLVDDDVRAEYERRALAHATTATVPATREACRRIAESLEPQSLAERHRVARAERGVFVRNLDDGMAELCLVSDAVIVHGARDRLTGMAKALRRDANGARVPDGGADAAGEAPNTADGAPDGPAGGDADADAKAAEDPRTLDQLRADIASDLLLTGAPHAHAVHDETGANLLDGVRGTVQVTIPVRSLTGLTGEAAHLTGYGPVAPEAARRIAAEAPGWGRLFRSPETGALLTVDRYEPTAAQRRFLRARDEHCRFPGCRQAARRCDIDHTVAHAGGGATVVGNLATLCRGHHVLKHHSPWRVRQRGRGDLEWISPTGAVYAGRPESNVRFVESEECASEAGSDPPPRADFSYWFEPQPCSTPAPF